ncbi:helix-turn-helix domain-containing protein, partial [Paramuribaculum intestinale]
MNKLRQVLRCHANGNGAKSISNLTGIARNTVRKYLRRFMELNRGIEDLLKLEDPD